MGSVSRTRVMHPLAPFTVFCAASLLLASGLAQAPLPALAPDGSSLKAPPPAPGVGEFCREGGNIVPIPCATGLACNLSSVGGPGTSEWNPDEASSGTCVRPEDLGSGEGGACGIAEDGRRVRCQLGLLCRPSSLVGSGSSEPRLANTSQGTCVWPESGRLCFLGNSSGSGGWARPCPAGYACYELFPLPATRSPNPSFDPSGSSSGNVQSRLGQPESCTWPWEGLDLSGTHAGFCINSSEVTAPNNTAPAGGEGAGCQMVDAATSKIESPCNASLVCVQASTAMNSTFSPSSIGATPGVCMQVDSLARVLQAVEQPLQLVPFAGAPQGAPVAPKTARGLRTFTPGPFGLAVLALLFPFLP